jgi:hypothetical protein
LINKIILVNDVVEFRVDIKDIDLRFFLNEFPAPFSILVSSVAISAIFALKFVIFIKFNLIMIGEVPAGAIFDWY